MRLQAVTLLGFLCLLTSCATPLPRSQGPVPVETTGDAPAGEEVFGPPLPAETAPVPVSPPPRVAEPAPALPPPPATPSSTLLAAVDEAIAAGELERAAALCERALRISPRDAFLWYRLADIRYEQGRYADAAGFARRAMSFAVADPVLRLTIDSLLRRAEGAIAGE